MKKQVLSFIFLIFSLVGYSQNQIFTGIKTFTNPPKFLNLQYSGTNTKFLTLNASNQLMWSSLSAITPSTPTFSEVLASGNSNANSSIHFSLSGSGNTASFYAGSIVYGNASNGNNTTSGLAGFNNNNNDGRLADLGFSQGLRLRTLAGGGVVTLKTSNVTSSRNIEWPNASGTVALKRFKEYSVILDQAGTNAPEVVSNLSIEDFPTSDISFSYVAAGTYSVTSASDAFTAGKTVVFINGNALGYVCGTTGVNDSSSSFNIVTSNLTSHSLTNNALQNAQLTIRVYL